MIQNFQTNKLTLDYLLPYQQTNLKLQYFGDLVGSFAGYMEGMGHNPVRIFYNGQDNKNINAKMESEIFLTLQDIKPILRSMASLKFGFEHNGENINPLMDFFQEDERQMYEFANSKVPIVFNYPYTMWLQLFEWQIDVFGLIDLGLAVDMHTLSVQNDG